MSGFERIKYPDGQISVKIMLDPTKHLHIHERINSYEDLFFIKSIVDAARSVDSTVRISLSVPCMFGQRSDRRFVGNQSFDLKLITEFINSCGFDRVEVLDPHSDVTLALLNNSERTDNRTIMSSVIMNAAMRSVGDEFVLVSPDAGAYKKVFGYAEEFNHKVVAAVKHRDLQGKVDLTFLGDVKDKVCLIIDDICDGGYTFQVLGKALKEQGAKSVYLYVTHGYFSKGFYDLYQCIDHIYCTNSVKDLSLSDEYVYDSKPVVLGDYVTQYKVV